MENVPKIVSMLAGKLAVEQMKDLSDEELIRCLSNTVAPEWCIRNAKQLRDSGLLTMEIVRNA